METIILMDMTIFLSEQATRNVNRLGKCEKKTLSEQVKENVGT